jgi:two-component system response regulator DesR
VLLVDEHPIVGVGLRTILAADSQLEVETTTDPEAGARAVADGSADVVVSEISFSGRTLGLDLLRSTSRSPVVLLTGLRFPGVLRAALDGGAEGVVSKADPVEQIVKAIQAVAGGGTAVSPEAVGIARSALRRPATRELAVITEVASGATNGEIAERLSIRRPTVEAVLRRLFDRYSVTSRTALVAVAIREGWLFDLAA